MNTNILNIANTLNTHGFSCHIAGGFVRDHVMNRESNDIDLVTDATPDQVERLFTCAHTVGKQFGVVTVAEGGEQFEIATLRMDAKTGDGRRPDSVTFCDSLFSDGLRRDFTINAMFLNPLTGNITDSFNGIKDIRGKIIQCVGCADHRFIEDHLRMLRAIRFAVTLGFTIERKTWGAICRQAHFVRKISPERIQAELMKILACPSADQGILMLDDCGMLEHILPEVTNLAGVEQPEEFHPEGDVFVHTILALNSVSRNASALDRLAVILHDIGKPTCQTWNDSKNRFQFIGHDKVGARMAEDVMRRLKFSRKEIDAVVFAVRNHMRIHQFTQMKLPKQLALVNHEHFPVLRTVAMADHGTAELLALIEHVQSIPVPTPLIDGNDLIAAGFTPGPRFSKILSVIREQQITGRVTTKEQALKIARGIVT